MKKKSNITLYFIVGILLIISAYMFFSWNRSKYLSTDNTIATSFGADATLFNSIREYCIEDSVIKAIDKGSIYAVDDNEDYLEYDINRNIMDCVDFTYFNEKGYTVFGKYPDTQVKINDETLEVKGTFKLTLLDPNSEQKTTVDEFDYSFDKSSYTKLELDSSGKTTKIIQLVSPDNKFSIDVPKGTSFTGYDGEIIDTVQIKVVDKSEYSKDGKFAASKYVVGHTVYYVTDSHTNQDVRICINYDTTLIKEGTEKDMVVMWYDEERGVWSILPSTINMVANVVCANQDHFSIVGPGVQTFEKSDLAVFYEEHIHHMCGPNPPGEPLPLDYEWTRRYNGIIGFEPYETAVWQLNDYCDELSNEEHLSIGIIGSGSTNDYKNKFDVASGNEPNYEPEHCGSVYPPLYKGLVVRSHTNDEFTDQKYSSSNEFQLGPSGLTKLGLESTDSIIVQMNQLFHFSGNSPTNFKSSGKGESLPSLNDRWNTGTSKYNLDLTSAADWAEVESFRPNEHAELVKEDFDDDDSEKLFYDDRELEKKCLNDDGIAVSCFKCLLPGQDTPEWCDDLNADGGMGYTFSNKKDFLSDCNLDFIDKAAKKYEEYNIAEYGGRLIPYNSNIIGDGIIDFRWVNGQLIRNYAICKVVLEDTTIMGYEKMPLAEFDVANVATPNTWGYGLELNENGVNIEKFYKENIQSYEKYKKDNLDVGFAGVGNDDTPTIKNFNLAEGHATCDPSRGGLDYWMTVECSLNDVCHVHFLNKDIKYEFCVPDIAGRCPEGVKTCQELYGQTEIVGNNVKCKDISIPLMIDYGPNPIEGWVRNTDESMDVCAYLTVNITVSGKNCGDEEPPLFGCMALSEDERECTPFSKCEDGVSTCSADCTCVPYDTECSTDYPIPICNPGNQCGATSDITCADDCTCPEEPEIPELTCMDDISSVCDPFEECDGGATCTAECTCPSFGACPNNPFPSCNPDDENACNDLGCSDNCECPPPLEPPLLPICGDEIDSGEECGERGLDCTGNDICTAECTCVGLFECDRNDAPDCDPGDACGPTGEGICDNYCSCIGVEEPPESFPEEPCNLCSPGDKGCKRRGNGNWCKECEDNGWGNLGEIGIGDSGKSDEDLPSCGFIVDDNGNTCNGGGVSCDFADVSCNKKNCEDLPGDCWCPENPPGTCDRDNPGNKEKLLCPDGRTCKEDLSQCPGSSCACSDGSICPQGQSSLCLSGPGICYCEDDSLCPEGDATGCGHGPSIVVVLTTETSGICLGDSDCTGGNNCNCNLRSGGDGCTGTCSLVVTEPEPTALTKDVVLEDGTIIPAGVEVELTQTSDGEITVGVVEEDGSVTIVNVEDVQSGTGGGTVDVIIGDGDNAEEVTVNPQGIVTGSGGQTLGDVVSEVTDLPSENTGFVPGETLPNTASDKAQGTPGGPKVEQTLPAEQLPAEELTVTE